MNEPARTTILRRLRAAVRGVLPVAPPEWNPPALPGGEARIDRLQRLLEAVRTEVHRVPRTAWVESLKPILRQRGVRSLLYAPGTPLGRSLEAGWDDGAADLPRRIPFERPMEDCKAMVFEVDAAVTSTAGAVADVGSLVLRPDAREPRSMSLVPPLHIAVLDSAAVFDSLGAIMRAQNWSAAMPANLVLVSGPSRTADIEMTLAFGVHGPKALVVLILVE